MNPGVIENDKNTDDQDKVAGDLRNGVTQGAVESAFGENTVKQKMFRARREPEYPDQQRDQEKDLNKAEVDAGQRRVPRKRDAGGIDRADDEKGQHGQTQDRADNGDQIFVDLEPVGKTAEGIA